MNAPKRRYRLRLDLHANTPDELGRVLRQLETDLIVDHHDSLRGDTAEHIAQVISGGADSGYVLHLDQDPTMTAERYEADLTAYLDAKRLESVDTGDAPR